MRIVLSSVELPSIADGAAIDGDGDLNNEELEVGGEIQVQ
jgi:hypothetical protein